MEVGLAVLIFSGMMAFLWVLIFRPGPVYQEEPFLRLRVANDALGLGGKVLENTGGMEAAACPLGDCAEGLGILDLLSGL